MIVIDINKGFQSLKIRISSPNFTSDSISSMFAYTYYDVDIELVSFLYLFVYLFIKEAFTYN